MLFRLAGVLFFLVFIFIFFDPVNSLFIFGYISHLNYIKYLNMFFLLGGRKIVMYIDGYFCCSFIYTPN